MVRREPASIASLLSVLVLGATLVRAQEPAAEPVLAAIRTHFEKVQAELTRYAKITFYGETAAATARDAAALCTERELWQKAEASGLLAKLPQEVRWLGHDLLVHDPQGGATAAYLRALHEAANGGNREVERDLFHATMAVGELGEKLVVDELANEKADRRAFWAAFLSVAALHASSAPPLEKRLATETDPGVQVFLARALASVGMPSSAPVLRTLLENTKEDAVQAAAIWATVELLGFDAIAGIEKVKPIGEKAAAEQKDGLEYLRQETSAKNKHGREVVSDPEFVARFGDLLTCPTIRWLAGEKLLEDDVLATPVRLDAPRKKALFERLVDSRGFGLEAVKGSLFESLAKGDETTLLRLRAAGFHAPNSFSRGRAKTLEIMVRRVRQEL